MRLHSADRVTLGLKNGEDFVLWGYPRQKERRENRRGITTDVGIL